MFLKELMKLIADEEFTDSVGFGWLISHAGESGWPLLFLEFLHWPNLLPASTSSSSAAPCKLGHPSLAEGF